MARVSMRAMPKLNQVIAAAKGATSHAEDEITKAYHFLQKPDIFLGQTRTYEPKEDGGEVLPGESQKVQTTVAEEIERFVAGLTRVVDVTATRNWGNTSAKADVVVDGRVLIKDAPVEFLLFLEKRLQDVETLLKRIPLLDPALKWTREESDGLFHADPVRTIRSKKVLRNHVKAAATDKHPAQVETYTEDEPVGYWTTTRLSGAVPATQVAAWREKLVKLAAAVKFAREEANNLEVTNQEVGRSLLDYVFGA